jgi:hypothetical protein
MNAITIEENHLIGLVRELAPEKRAAFIETFLATFWLGLRKPAERCERRQRAMASKRLARIHSELERGFLDEVFLLCQSSEGQQLKLPEAVRANLSQMVNSMEGEMGRLVVGTLLLQLAAKSICPQQCIRLCVGGGTQENFSWQDGLSLRFLAREISRPIFRKYGLVSRNDGEVFIPRSLAKNYPYSQLYKAASRGAKTEWLAIVDMAEFGKINPTTALKQLVVMLFNRSETFKLDSELTLNVVKGAAGKLENLDQATKFIRSFVDSSTYAARLFRDFDAQPFPSP